MSCPAFDTDVLSTVLPAFQTILEPHHHCCNSIYFLLFDLQQQWIPAVPSAVITVRILDDPMNFPDRLHKNLDMLVTSLFIFLN